MNAVSGFLIYSTEATRVIDNAEFLIKMASILIGGLAVWYMLLSRGLAADAPFPVSLKVVAVITSAASFIAIVFGARSPTRSNPHFGAPMDPLLRWIRDTPLGHFMRETGNAFPVAEMSHFIGLSLLMGVMIVVDLRLLGVFKQASYSAVLKLLPLAVVGLPGRAPYNIGSAVAIFGCSADGLLTAQSLAWCQKHNLARLAAAGIFCAGADPSMGGNSRTLGMLLGDGELPASRTDLAEPPRQGYMRDIPRSDPVAYPAQYECSGKASTDIVIVGARDFAWGSAVNLHSRLVANGVKARLHVWEGGRDAFSMANGSRRPARPMR